jgi:hypothetical protein
MADTSGGAAAETPLDRVQRQIVAVEDDLDELRAKKKAEKDEGEKKKIEERIDKKEELLKSLTDKELILRAEASGGTAVPGACRLPPRPRPIPPLTHRRASCSTPCHHASIRLAHAPLCPCLDAKPHRASSVPHVLPTVRTSTVLRHAALIRVSCLARVRRAVAMMPTHRTPCRSFRLVHCAASGAASQYRAASCLPVLCCHLPCFSALVGAYMLPRLAYHAACPVAVRRLHCAAEVQPHRPCRHSPLP